MPRWRADDEIFFLALDGMLMSARFDAAMNRPAAIPLPLFQTGLADIPIWNRPYSRHQERTTVSDSSPARRTGRRG